MDKSRLHFIRCPYCGITGSHGSTVSKNVGVFRERGLHGSLVLKQCYKCSKIHARREIGGEILWEDIPAYLKQEIKKEHFEDLKELPEWNTTTEYEEYIKWKERKRVLKKNKLIKLKTKSKGGKQ